MGERVFEDEVRRILRQDFSQGTEEFRDELLARCLAVLDDGCRSAMLDDCQLESLAAAGDSAATGAIPGDNDDDAARRIKRKTSY